jgi:hypothetical protein
MAVKATKSVPRRLFTLQPMLLGGAMISALLLPLLFSGAPAQPAVTRDDPPIRLWISNDRRFLPGDRAKVEVRTDYDGYLLVLHVDPEGRLRVLFPLDPDKDNFVRGDKKYEVRGRGGREAFEPDATGRGTVYAAVSRDPFRFDGLTLGDHWDYQALAPARLREHPEPELNNLLHRMAQSSFDYDLLNYDVTSRSAYASNYPSRYYGSAYYDDWCTFSCGRPYYGHSRFGLSIGLFYGRPYRRYYYDPYFYAYSPLYDPFFYDPYYYAPAYYPRYVSPRRYYGYYDSYYHDRYRGYNRPYTPYRFRGSDGFTAGYRNRGHDLRRSVNTVYTPPISRVREPVTSTPMRRITSPAADLPSGLAPRRAVGHETRLNTEPVEARRAREPEASRRAAPADERKGPQREAAPARRAAEPRAERTREQPRAERAREEARPVQRAAPEARPQRRDAERSSSPPPQVRSSGRAESRGSAGGPTSGGGSRRAGDGESRRR